MEFIFLIFLFFLRSSHVSGFSHFKQEGWNSLYVVTGHEDLDLYVDGYPTGLRAPCRIYIEPNKTSVDIELRRLDHSLFYERVSIREKQSFLVGYIQRHLHRVTS